MTTEAQPEEEGNKRNIILGYQALNELRLGIQRANDKLDVVASNSTDHEARIRALEVHMHSASASSTTKQFLYGAIWPMASAVLQGLALYLAIVAATPKG